MPIAFPTTGLTNGQEYSPPGITGVKYTYNAAKQVWVGAAASSGTGSTYTLPMASTSVLGGVKVDATTINISGTGVISSASIGAGVGSGQTWQDFTKSRILGDQYTNTTGKPIMVMINVEGYRVTGSFTIGAITKPITNIDWTQPYTFVVPDNTTYSFNLGGPTGTFWWIELR
jgi:hypothetical protein